MKPPPFDYCAPTTTAEALALLAEHGADAKIIAGGQSLMPLLALRLARPSTLIDLNGVEELSRLDSDVGSTTIGAMVRHRSIERSEVIARNVPLLRDAVPFIGHPAIRTRGTIGGSLAHADPAAELPAVAVALDATFVVSSTARGERTISATDFFRGYFNTSLEWDEILVSVRFPNAAPDTGVSVHEVSRRHGDFAMAAVAASVTLAGDIVADVRLGMINVADRPVRATEAEQTLRGVGPTDSVIAEAAAVATRALSPVSDLHATAAYRRSVAGVLVRRALTSAVQRARSAS